MTDLLPPPARQRGRRVGFAAAAVALAVAAGLVVSLTGGSKTATVVESAPAGGAPGEGPAAESDPVLTSMLAEWADFPVDADPRPILVLRQVAGSSGFRSGDAKVAFMTGNWDGPADLPKSPAEADGYPVISAAEALTRLKEADGAARAKPEGKRLRVSDMRLGAVDVLTDRGMRPLPAWRVTFNGSIGPNWVPAIAPPARYVHPLLDRDSYWDMRVSADGRTVTMPLLVDTGFPGPCDSVSELRIVESQQAVAVRIVSVPRVPVSGEKPGDCEQHGVAGQLAKPLGNRVLLADNGGRTEVIHVEPAAS